MTWDDAIRTAWVTIVENAESVDVQHVLRDRRRTTGWKSDPNPVDRTCGPHASPDDEHASFDVEWQFSSSAVGTPER